jgi:hypothetical protein
MLSRRRYWVDPPLGYLYGFPKLLSLYEIGSEDTMKKWLVQNGYPQEVIDKFGSEFTVRLVPAADSPPEA